MGWSKSAWLVVLVTLAAATLRFYRLDAQSLWGDEAFSAIITAGGLHDVLNNHLSVNPPGYFLLLNLWRSVAGGSDFALRFPSALWGVLGITLTYRLGYDVGGDSLGIWGASITTLAPFHVFYSQEARMYTQLHAVACVLVLAYARLWKGGRRSWWLVISLASIASLWTHFFSAFAIAVLGVHFCLLKLWPSALHRFNPGDPGDVRSSPRWLDFFGANGSVLLLFSLYLPRFISQVQMYDSETWHQAPSAGELAGLPLALTTGQFLSRSGQTIGFVLMTFLVIVVALQILRALRHTASAKEWLLLWCMLSLVLPFTAFLIARLWTLAFSVRYLIIAALALYLLLAWGVTQTRERRFNQLLLIAVLVLMAWGLHNWYFDTSFAKPPVRDAARHVQESGMTNAPVIHGTATSRRLFEHYAPELDNRLLSGSPMAYRSEEIFERRGTGLVEPAAVPRSGFWYIMFPIHSHQFQSAQLVRFDDQFHREHEWDASGIELYYYANREH